jgi:hypothetical protein
LSVEKFIKTLGQAIQRKINLRDAAHYAAVTVPSTDDAPKSAGNGAASERRAAP